MAKSELGEIPGIEKMGEARLIKIVALEGLTW